MHLQICTILLSICLTLNSFFSTAQKNSVLYESGEKGFRTHCNACHSAHQEIYGPMLGSISKKKPEPWLISFIQNSQSVIKSGDPYAKELFKNFGNQVMPSFKELAEKDIKAILYYLEYESTHPSELLDDVAISSTNNSNIIKGKLEFLEHCAVCHFIHTESNFAPALGSVTKRHDREWITSFIQNSQNVIKGGDAYAENLYQQFDQHVMTRMDFLSSEEVNSILDYIEFASTVNTAYPGERNTVQYKKIKDEKPLRKMTYKLLSLSFIFMGFISSSLLVHYVLQFNKPFNT